ncbi:uncharacterized beta-barrel protein YwiB (DUF1934 family) [Natranaerovirga pectinivora]|uniref:Uncharacterized beta-barrel protein YwiB (DUF1934 family) n=1 Tax=Natranaerovirga pectinivora TaxID=682400 RepID=A0A4R3MJQ0_9FIRM|nr:DUF1934 domain-containing protein [Natranaerovirga pectinivora]TCT13964.1 uncharacterized beta-barrel protein YwiB (DUF1934 family) [Natranaerovirga pectinivora]
MTKDVIISIKGIQSDLVESDSVEMITTGTYYIKNEKHYVNYIDRDLKEDSETNTTIKITNDKVDLIRFGGVSTHMIFELNKKHITHYDTPFGSLQMGIQTKKINIDNSVSHLNVQITYNLEVNNNFVSENLFELKVQSKKDSKIQLREFKDEVTEEDHL